MHNETMKVKVKHHVEKHELYKNTPNEAVNNCKQLMNEDFYCEQCPFKTKGKWLLKQHKHNKHTPDDKIKWFECDQCSYKTNYKQTLKQHKFNKHTPDDKIKWFECDQCTFKAKVKTNLKKHKLCKHTNDEEIKWFKCDKCSHKTKFRYSLIEHKFTIHDEKVDTGKKKFELLECDQCLFKTKHKISLKKHMVAKHGSGQSSVKTKSQSALRNHKIVHQKIKDCHFRTREFECDQCSYRTYRPLALKTHKFYKHASEDAVEWFQCGQCSFQAKNITYLKKHRSWKHTSGDEIIAVHDNQDVVGNKELAWFQGDHCLDRSQFDRNLQQHEKSQTSRIELFDCQRATLGNYHCARCSFKTDTYVLLRQHKMVHSTQVGQEITNYIVKRRFCESCSFETFSALHNLKHGEKCTSRQKTRGLECEERLHKTQQVKTLKMDKAERFQCDHCSYTTKYRGSLRNHRAIKHNETLNVKMYECNECPYKSPLKHHVMNHKLYKHTPDEAVNWFQCDNCPYRAKLKSDLKKHKKLVHCKTVQVFHCEQCSFKTNSEYRLKKHSICKHAPDDEIKWFECDQCTYKVKQRCNLNKHKLSKHKPDAEVEWFKCDKCPHKYKYKYDLRDHKVRVHNEKLKQLNDIKWLIKFQSSLQNHQKTNKIHVFECNHCSYKTNRALALKTHKYYTHTSEDEIKWFQCDGCWFKAKNKTYLKRHELWRHAPEDKIKWFKCDKCPFRTKHRSCLTHHIFDIHKEKITANLKQHPTPRMELSDCQRFTTLENYHCARCSFETDSCVVLRQHTMVHSTQIRKETSNYVAKNYCCKGCSFDTFSALHAIKHEEKCTAWNKTKWFKCDHCSFTTKYGISLRNHKVLKHNVISNSKIIQCDQCPYKSPWKNHIEKHKLYKHTPDAAINWFECDKCRYKAKSKHDLGKHKNLMHDRRTAKEFYCDQCSFKTKRKNYLKKHKLNMHKTGERTTWYACDQCSFGARHQTSLRNHKFVEHQISTKKMFKCSDCNYMTPFKSKLKIHVLFKHTPDEAVNWFECDKCRYKAKIVHDLNKHKKKMHKSKTD